MRVGLTISYLAVLIVFMIGMILVVHGHTPKPKSPDCTDTTTSRAGELATGWIMVIGGLIAAVIYGIYLNKSQF